MSLVRGGEFAAAKGAVEALLRRLRVGPWGGSAGDVGVEWRPTDLGPFAAGRAAEVILHRPGMPSERIGVVGEVSAAERARLALGAVVSAAELRLDRLEFAVGGDVVLVPTSDSPLVLRDVNLVVDRAVAWGTVARVIRAAGGGLLERCELVQVWEDADRLGAERKSFVVALALRPRSGSLSGDEANAAVTRIVDACTAEVGATLRR